MVLSRILSILENITEKKLTHCILCLRTAECRKIVQSKVLQKLLDLLDQKAVFMWKNLPCQFFQVCYICEGKLKSALKVLDLVAFGIKCQKLIRYYTKNSSKELNEALDNFIMNKHFVGKRKTYDRCCGVSNVAAVTHIAVYCENYLPLVRKSSTLLATDVLCIDIQGGSETMQTTNSSGPPASIEVGPLSAMPSPNPSTVTPISETLVIDDESDNSNDGTKETTQPITKETTQPITKETTQPITKKRLNVRQASDIVKKDNQTIPLSPLNQTVRRLPNTNIQIHNPFPVINNGASVNIVDPISPDQMIAVKNTHNSDFTLHRIVKGSDGFLYIPTLPARINNGVLEPINIITPDGTPVHQIESPIVAKAPSEPFEHVKIQSYPVEPIKPLNTHKKNKAVKNTGIKNVSSVQENDAKRKIGKEVTSNVSDPDTGPQPKMKPSNIDWEDKIPMDVITYMDATDPSTKPSPMGVISNVYSESECEMAASRLSERIDFENSEIMTSKVTCIE